MAKTLTDKFLKLVQKAPQLTVQSLEPKPAYQILHLWARTGANNMGGATLNVLDNSTKTWSRQPLVLVGATDPATLSSADVQDDDIWFDTTTAATPTCKVRVAGTWNTII